MAAGTQQDSSSPGVRGAPGARERLFIALPCPLTAPIASALAELRAAQDAGNSGLRTVDAATLHITLKFLGAVAADHTDAVLRAMDAALADAAAPLLSLKGAGSFHGALWLGVTAGGALTELAQRCDAAMESIGFAPERRPFRPHVTVARTKDNPNFDTRAWIRQHLATTWGEFAGGTVHLYRSETLAGGARYTVLHSVALR